MQYHLKSFITDRQRKTIETLGDDIWDAICDHVRERTFTIADCQSAVQKVFGYAPRTALDYAKIIVANVRAESNDAVIIRTGNMYRWA